MVSTATAEPPSKPPQQPAFIGAQIKGNTDESVDDQPKGQMLIVKSAAVVEEEEKKREGLVLSTDDEPAEAKPKSKPPRPGLVLSTDDDPAEQSTSSKPKPPGLLLCTDDLEESKQPTGPSWIITTDSIPAGSQGEAELAAAIVPNKVELTSTRVNAGGPIRINPNLPVEEKHRLIAQQMQR